MKGYIHNYTGEGKGKTTASLGLALRALGAGKKICIIQFLKNGDYSEVVAIRKLGEVYRDQIAFTQSGAERELFSDMTSKDRIAALQGEELFFHYLDENSFDLYILDEINTAAHYDLINSARVVRKIRSLESHGEIVMTGRYAPEDFLELADLVTVMEKKKHYADCGVPARVGIEM